MVVERSALLPADALAYLEQDALGNELLLGAAQRLGGEQAGPSFRWWVLRDEGEVRGGLLFCPPRGVIFSCMAGEAGLDLGKAIAPFLSSLSAVHAPEALGEILESQLELPGQARRTEIWVAEELSVKEAPGRWVWAQSRHRALLEGWVEDAWPEVGESVCGWIEEGRAMVWEDPQGVAVASAVGTREFAWGACLGFVYCEPSMRRRGYAAAVVSAWGRQRLAAKGGCLFLQVREEEDGARALYEALGFSPARAVLSWVKG